MNTTPMTPLHGQPESPAAGLLPLLRGQVTRVAAARERRVLWVQQGRVWATRTSRHTHQDHDHDEAEDQWLASGQTLELPPGSDWVIEPWPAARVGLMLALPSPSSLPPSAAAA